jgi:hypothetical protein
VPNNLLKVAIAVDYLQFIANIDPINVYYTVQLITVIITINHYGNSYEKTYHIINYFNIKYFGYGRRNKLA